MNMIKKKCGFVSITGLPNAGKSTLINNLVNEKVSIISHKVQTTQNAIRGVFTKSHSQIIFTDTPGLILPSTFFKKQLSRAIFNNTYESDINLVVFDPNRKISEKEKEILKKLIRTSKNNFLIINKIDLVKKTELLKISEKYNHLFNFKKTFMISALKKKGLNELIEVIITKLPKNKWLYDKRDKTDQKNEFIFSEITREKVFQLINKEIPYDISVTTEINLNKITQFIFVKKASQKPILIGKEGKKIKEIGMRARRDIQKKINKRIYLELKVKISK